ncbi:MAG: motif [Fimbriimonadaceae bacterium]|jgi:hypothetical protein|nr:motif [Fimbriimonadaceae bacterium]
MRTFTRLSLVAGLAVFAQMASAALSYNVLDAKVVFNTGETSNLTVNTSGNSIDFTAGSIPLFVGDGAHTVNNRDAAVVTIIYTVESDKAISGLDLIFSGMAFNMAAVGYSELVEAWSASGGAGPIIASTDGVYTGAGLGGSNSPFTNSTSLTFANGPVFSYKVKKTFTLANLDSNPAASFATLNLIEQNAVPEPATMGALAIGALGLLARRRRK